LPVCKAALANGEVDVVVAAIPPALRRTPSRRPGSFPCTHGCEGLSDTSMTVNSNAKGEGLPPDASNGHARCAGRIRTGDTVSVLFTDVFVYSPDGPSGVVGPTDVLVTGQRITAIGSALARDGGRIVAGEESTCWFPASSTLTSTRQRTISKARSRACRWRCSCSTSSGRRPAAPFPSEAYLRTCWPLWRCCALARRRCRMTRS